MTLLQDSAHASPLPPGQKPPPGHPSPEDELVSLQQGNKQFRDHINATHPGFFDQSAKGQHPPFLVIACSDSRVSEGTIFNALPGTIFASRNISNQFHSVESSVYSTLSYAVAELNVNHVVVLGHYGCGGVKAALSPFPESPIDAAKGAIQAWIEPIRELYRTSTRPEIEALRKEEEEGNVDDATRTAAWRALVEENVKGGVARISGSTVIANHFAKLESAETARNWRTGGEDTTSTPVFIHGWTYDIANGHVYDLGASVGPPGVPIPKSAFPPPSKF